MPSADRDAHTPRASDRVLRHQHSASSDCGRALVPMWDSSDPERAPPPLPLNPQSPSVTARPSTSSAIQSAHAALTERARESSSLVPQLAKRMSEISPERSPGRGAAHRRMQSLQPGSVRDLSAMLENNGKDSTSSTPRPLEKHDHPSTPLKNRDPFVDARNDDRHDRSLVPSPRPTPTLTPILRPTARRPNSLILGENTPPQSATMLALQRMSTPTQKDADPPLSNITNSSTALVKASQSMDFLSTQITSLHTIAASLQKDMSQLSRRSRDNATDLYSLKEATNARDEDIRKSLRDLLNHMAEAKSRASTRDPHSGPLLLEGKPNPPSPLSLTKMSKFSLPRIPSPNSFAASLDRDNLSTPSLYGADTSGSIALIERIIQEMGTREGQDMLLGRLSELADKVAGLASSDKVEEVRQLVLANQSNAMVPLSAGGRDGHGPSRPRNFSFSQDSGFHTGPTTARVQNLLQAHNTRRSSAPFPPTGDVVNEDVLKVIRTVKDSVAQGGGLTAEVKALVRELRGEVLGMGREIGRRLDEAGPKSAERGQSASQAEINRVVEEVLAEMKQQMSHMVKEHRRQSGASATSRASVVDYQEIYNALRAALKDSQKNKSHPLDLSREDIIEAVREAWESYRPETAVQLGLDREEILACLQEGLQGHVSTTGATRDEVFQAVVEGLKHFTPPPVDSAASLSRDEILDAVRECLEEFEFPVAPSTVGAERRKNDITDAVKRGLEDFSSRDRERGFSSNRSALIPADRDENEIESRLRDIMEFMQAEFKAAAIEAKQNCETHGRDTEQVLDATKDGFEKLRTDFEAYVDRATGAAGQEEFMSKLVRSLEEFRTEISAMMSKTSKEVVKGDIDSARAGGAKASSNDEILGALKTGLESVRSDIGELRKESRNDGALTTVNNKAVVPAEMLRHDDIKKLEVLITQLRVKVEAMDGPQPPPRSAETLSKADLSGMEEMLRNVHESVAGKTARSGVAGSSDAASRDDVEAIETILRNTKSRLDDLIDGEQAVRKEHIDALETLFLETKESLSGVSDDLKLLSQKKDVTAIETLLTEVVAALDEVKDQQEKALDDPDRVTKTDVEAVETACLELKGIVQDTIKDDLSKLPSKQDMSNLEKLVKEFGSRIETHADTNAKAFEERQAETVGVSERVTEVKTFLEEFQGVLKDKLEDGAAGIDAIHKLLETMGDLVSKNSTISEDLDEMFETMKQQFEESKAGVVGAKIESDEKFQQTTDVLGAKIDERIGELIAKYDAFQLAAEERATKGEARDVEMSAAMDGTKAVADDLKTLIDTLGSAVTDSLERMEEASKTVFTRVEDLINKSDENHSDDKAEHHLTRSQVQQALSVVEGLQGHVVEYQPQILDSIKEVLRIVGQHYEHSKTSTVDIQEKIWEARPPEQPLLPPVEKYDDTGVHEKLDRLVDHSQTAAGKAMSQLDTLEQVRQQLLATASEVTALAAAQTQRITDEHEDHSRELQETTTALAAARAEQRELESGVAFIKDETKRLRQAHREEEDRFRQSLQQLRKEQEALTKQKTRLAADVSSLETALRLRREELHDMEARAAGLERRILEGVMDHSRVLLLSKAGSGAGRDAMSRKRVVPDSTTATAAITKSGGGKSRAALDMAMSAKSRLLAPPATAANRRILSLSQIAPNVPAGGFKRSQSVRTPRGQRKVSWAPPSKGYGDLNRGEDKENQLKESDEEAYESASEAPAGAAASELSLVDTEDGDGSDAETLRRSSRGTSALTGDSYDESTDAGYSDEDGESVSEVGTESYVGTEEPGSSLSAGGQGSEIVVFEG